jgi:hypothetical protein
MGQDIFSATRSVRSRQHPQASESTEYSLGPPMPPHINIKSMAQWAESFTCREGLTDLSGRGFDSLLVCICIRLLVFCSLHDLSHCEYFHSTLIR